ncbi:MAG: ComEC/Rec2 family competence protein [bacterium]|nr:ComEC/Rec2 family competence protein [bacterium]
MAGHQVFFFSTTSFLTGVFLVSAAFSLVWISVAVLFLILLFLFWGWFHNRRFYFWLAGISIFIFVGGFYFTVDDFIFVRNQKLIFGEKIDFQATIINNPRQGNGSQQAKIDLKEPLAGRILVNLPLYPFIEYGDVLELKGSIKNLPDDGYGRYLAKERLVGVIDFPEINIIDRSRGNILKEFLFSFRNKVIGVFQRFLPGPQAAFLSGLTLGERGEFSDSFNESLKRSGTTHLVALSGYNITVLATAVLTVFLNFFRRRIALILASLAIIGFVIMTGAEASVVRAGIMGLLVILAQQSGRIYSFRNATALVALVMVLVNPKILVFDVGFQLSFLALIGIVYLKPLFLNSTTAGQKKSFLNWRDNFWTTTSAQLAVLPILFLNFGYFSLNSILANLLVLELVPLMMALGFLLAGVSFVSNYLSWLLVWPIHFLLSIAMAIIDFFGRWAWLWEMEFNFGFLILYYLITGSAIWFWRYYEKRRRN